MTFLCIVGSVLCWALAALNAVLYVTDGKALSLFAAFWCLAMACWVTYCTVNMVLLDRDRRSWYS